MTAFLLAVIVPAVCIALFTVSATRERERAHFEQRFISEVKQIDNAVNMLFKQFESDLEYLSQQAVLQQASGGITIYRDQKARMMTPLRTGGVESQLYQLFEQYGETHKDVSYIYFGNFSGGYVQWPMGATVDNYDPVPRPWFQTGVVAKGEINRSNAYYWQADDVALVSTVKLIKDTEGADIGVLGLDISLKALSELIQASSFGHNSSLLLVEDNGRILVDTGMLDNQFEFLSDVYGDSIAMLPKSLDPRHSVEIDGEERQIFEYQSKGLNWRYIGTIPVNEIDAFVEQQTRIIWLVTLVAVVLFGVLSVIISRLLLAQFEQKQQQIIQARKKAERANQAKSDFLARMSHEIRTPLNGVLGMSQLLAQSELTDDQYDKVRSINESGDHLIHVINEILDVSKIEADKMDIHPVECHLDDLILDLADSYRASALLKELDFLVDTVPLRPLTIKADVVRLKQVIGNLLSNAIKFTDSGFVLLKGRVQALHDDRVNLDFYIEDTGIGIEKSEMKNIFSAFNQADESTTRKYGGTGLGLALSASLVKLMGGKLCVESVVNHGSRFYFNLTFPLVSQSEPDTDELKISEQVFADSVIWLVDDCEQGRSVMQQMFAQWGLEIATFESMAQFESYLSQLTSFQERAVLFLDYFLDRERGGETGLDALERVTQLLPSDTNVVLLSSTASPEFERRYQHQGVSRVLYKPVLGTKVLEVFADCQSAERKRSDDFSLKQLTLKNKLDNQSKTASLDKKVLVVEDNPVNFTIISKLLEAMGHEVNWAKNGQQAIELYLQNNYHLVLMDCMLPLMDGYAATRRIREWEMSEQRHSTPVLALTADVTEENRKRCEGVGMNGFIEKPFKLDAISQVIHKFLNV